MKPLRTVFTLSALAALVFGTHSLHSQLSHPRPWDPQFSLAHDEPELYRIRYTASGQVDLSGLFSEKRDEIRTAQNYSSEWSGTLKIQTVRTDENEVRLRLQAPEIDSLRVEGMEDTTELAQTLKTGIEVVAGTDGKIRSFGSTTQLSALGEGLIQSVLGSLQLSLPAEGPQAHWQSLEIDGTGSYQAQYEVVSSIWNEWFDKKTTLSRQKLKYTSVSAASSGTAAQLQLRAIPSGTTKIELGGQCRCVFESLIAEEATELLAGRGRRLGHSEIKLELDRIEGESVATGVAEIRFHYSLSGSERRAQASRDLQTRILGTTTWSELSSGLRGPVTEETGLTLHLKLKAHLLLHPEAATEIGAMLKGLAPSDPKYHLMVGALSKAGTESAQTVLSSLLVQRESSMEDARILIPLLSAASEPSQATEELLARLSQEHPETEIRESALLAMGALAQNLQRSEPRRAEALIAGLASELARTTEPEHKAAVVAALGNSGSPALLETLAPILESAEATPMVKAEALFALRSLDDSPSEKLLLGALNPSSTEELREQAARALAFRNPTEDSIEGQAKLLGKEPSPKIRMELMNNLGRALENAPGRLRSILESDG